MKIPEYRCQNAVLFFQDDAEGAYYTLNVVKQDATPPEK